MKLGIFGTTASGKSTIMAALTGARGDKSQDRSRGDTKMAVVTVTDERIDFLSALHQPKKTSYARVEYMLPDPGVGAVRSESELWSRLRTCDALVCVLRNFSLHGGPPPQPRRDLEDLESDMIVADMAVLEKRIERLETDRKRGKKPAAGEQELLVSCMDRLDRGEPLRLAPDLADHPSLRGFTLLSAKPLLVVVNNDDEDENEPEWGKTLDGVETITVRGKLEKDIAAMTPVEAEEFIEAYNIGDSAVDRVIESCLRILKRISFFTVGPEEVKAWPIREGTKALEAAGEVHTDMMKGFIRAEVVSLEDLRASGNFQEAKKAGLVRLEGKEYTVRDGDVINFRFNIQ